VLDFLHQVRIKILDDALIS